MAFSINSLVENIKSAVFCENPDLMTGIKNCNKTLRILNHNLTEAKTVGEKQNLTTAIGQVKSFKAMFNAMKITGGGYGKQTAWYNVRWSDTESAFKNRIRTGVITNLKHTDPKLFLRDASAIFKRRILDTMKKEESIKVNTVFCGEFIRQTANGDINELKYFTTKNSPIYRDTDIKTWFMHNVETQILTELEDFEEKESGWALSAIINLQININKFVPQLGSSYIELPPQIERKKACINVKNDDNRCFAWAIVSALYPAKKNSDRTSNYPDPSQVLDLTGLHFPMTVKQISRFEKQNLISVNAYVLKKFKKHLDVLPTYLTKAKQSNHVNLLIVQNVYCDDDNENNEEPIACKYHFVWIKNLSRLLSTQLSNHKSKNYFCDRCLHYFYTETGLEKHYEDCVKMNDCKIRLPTKDNNIINFKNFKNKAKAPFVIYADLECLLVPSTDTNKYQVHQPCSIAYYVKCCYDSTLSFYRSYRGHNCVEWFTRELENFAEDLETVFLCPLPMNPLTPEEKISYDNAVLCHICEKPLQDKKVRDHDHLTGKYRGAAHEDCNINFQDSHTVPVVFHNLSGYDSHFIIKNIASEIRGRIDVLPLNKEKYIAFTKHLDQNLIKFRFIDSYRFMASGLETLASYLTEYPELQAEIKLDDEKLKLLTRKGVYPYDYFDCWEKFNETTLPEKSKFYNQLKESHISAEDYEHAKCVWSKFEIKNLGEYSDLYLKTDVLLLSCVFEHFRQSCLETYGLDPAHYYTLPGYTWDCMLKHTNISLELLTDIDMIMFIERGIRGGLSQCSLRHAKANNKYMSGYNSSKQDQYLILFDINNQYGWSMQQRLPFGGFKWLNDIENFNVMNIPDESNLGYILEVDLEYPEELHDLDADIPFCPEHRSAPDSKQKKLMATLYKKERYVIHYRYLKQALSHGLKLSKIYRILEFRQSAWLKSYIDLNTKLRTAAKNEFEKNLFKLMNNAVFGKTMENIRKHCIVKLVSKWEGRYGAEALISKPEFRNSLIFDENLVAIEMNKVELFFNKPIYVGMAILDISKTKIYEFHYDYMKPIFGNKCRAAYTDTDSIVYVIKDSPDTPNIYEIMKRDCEERFDTSDYPENNIFQIPRVNKKVLGLMKDEMNGKIMTEFVGLRSKMYAINVEGKDIRKKAKGVQKHIVRNRITFDDYINCLNTSTEKSINQKMIKSEKHEVSSITQTKIALNSSDDKRYLIPGNLAETLPWGHYSIMNASMITGSTLFR